MHTCLILDDYQNAALGLADWDRLSGAVAVSTITDHIPDRDALVARIEAAEILVIMRERTPFPADLLARLPRLRLLVTSGMRNASIDLEAAKARGIAVCGTDSSPTPPTELTWALILGLARHLPVEAAAMRADGPWQSTIGADLAGATLGILGLGKIGERMARIGRAFGMEVMAWSQNLTAEKAAAAGATLAPSKEALCEAADFLTLHLVLSERSRGSSARRNCGGCGRAPTSSTRPGPGSWIRRRSSARSRRAALPGPGSTCSIPSRCPLRARSAACRTSSRCPISATCRGRITRRSSRRRWRTSRRGSKARTGSRLG